MDATVVSGGLDQGQVNDVTRRLAGDWPDYSAAERAAFAFTRKQAQEPASITEADIHELERHYGPEGA